MKIKDILTIDLSEDIKNVIDLEDISEKEIQTEIENYIVTDGLAKKYSDFVTTYTSNILETGVWKSGFYGSGKSYFGKLVGYMLSNRMIAGTPARERIIKRFSGIGEEALKNATVIYLYDTLQLSETNWQTTIQAQQRQLIQNVYTKRLLSQLSDNIASAVIKQASGDQLHKFFHGNDFQFFDPQGNFVGKNLKISEEILYRTSKTFVDGATLEKDLKQPPTGYTYGTVISSVAALMRAGKIIAKYNGVEKFSWRDEGVSEIFQTVKDFRKSSFKAVSKSLSALQRQELAQFLLDIEAHKYIDKKINFNTNDFDLVNAIRETAKHFVDMVKTLRNSDKEFDKLFPLADGYAFALGNFTGVVSEANYTDRAIEFLPERGEFRNATQYIQKVANFIRNNLPKVKEWKAFMEAVQDELKKAARNHPPIQQIKTDFDVHYKGDVILDPSPGTFQVKVKKIRVKMPDSGMKVADYKNGCTMNCRKLQQLVTVMKLK